MPQPPRCSSPATRRLFNAGLRDQVMMRNLDLVDAARMFAATDMGVADAIITVWRAKYDYGYWRPITAINLTLISTAVAIVSALLVGSVVQSGPARLLR